MSFRLQVNSISQTLEQRAKQLVKNTAFGILSDVREAMAESKSGREYKRKGRPHIASAPGEAPAIDTSTLANSINVEVDGLTATVGTNVEYAMHLEFGTTRMEPRPFFGPAFEKAKPEFEQGLKDLL